MVCRGGEVRGQGGGGRAKSRVAAQMFAGLLVPDTAAGAPAAPLAQLHSRLEGQGVVIIY